MVTKGVESYSGSKRLTIEEELVITCKTWKVKAIVFCKGIRVLKVPVKLTSR